MASINAMQAAITLLVLGFMVRSSLKKCLYRFLEFELLR